MLVHLRRQKQRLTEMQIVAMTGHPEAEKVLKSLIESYRKQLFPGLEDSKKDTSMEDAKRALAEETQKVYMVRRLESVNDLRDSVQRAVDAGAPELAKAAAQELKKKEEANARVRRRLSKPRPNQG